MTNYTKRTTRGQPLRTKIVCTIGPSSRDETTIRRLINAGMTVARLNMSHGDHATHRENFKQVRDIAASMDREVAILFDLCGPKIRLREVDCGSFEVKKGESVKFVRGDQPTCREAFTASYEPLVDDVQVGETIYINDGSVCLRVTDKTEDELNCTVVIDGIVSSRKGINLPGTKVSTPALTDKDIQDLALGVELGADLFALSFVRQGSEVIDLRERLEALGSDAQIISKIEKPQALDALDEIIDASDAIMVARGDLGIEVPVETVPMHQKHIINRCREELKPVIVATQVLESMVENAVPTRAEVSDIANAIEDGCDALMLSAETAAGKHPRRSAETMARVARRAEKEIAATADPSAFISRNSGDALRKAMVVGASMISGPLGAKFIVLRSETGVTARYLSKVRGNCPVLVAHSDSRVLRRHALFWGVTPVHTHLHDAEQPTMEDELRQTAQVILNAGLVDHADRIIVISRFPWGEQLPPNNIRTMRVGEALGALPMDD
ncbi:MAG: pyruvate kinase [Planctomycetota bacterium]|jgi:pyruvate kinase